MRIGFVTDSKQPTTARLQVTAGHVAVVQPACRVLISEIILLPTIYLQRLKLPTVLV